MLVVKMMRLQRAFRTSNSQICRVCKNDYLPGQIVINRNENTIRCVECEWEATYMTKIYPGEKPAYTPHPPRDEGPYPRDEEPYPRDEGPPFMERQPKHRGQPVEHLR
jgi:hypothetical protein